MKKTTAFCLIILILVVMAGTALAAPEYQGEVTPNAVMLLDAVTGQVLFEKNADEQIRPASTTKILTCIVALENSNMDDIVKVGPEGDWTGSGYSLLGTKDGEEIVMKDLLYGLMLVSGNDAAATVAVHIGGSEEKFVEMMNEKAQEIGMTGSQFKNPHGTDTDGHYVTARDMSKLALYAAKNEQFMDIVGTASYDMPATNKNEARTVLNTNMLLRTDEEAEEGAYYEYAIGIKTGSTPKAFRCLVSAAEKDGTKLICLVYGDETEDGVKRWPLSKSLYEFGFENYKTVNVQEIIDNAEPPTIAVQNAGNEDMVIELAIRNTGDAFVTLEKQVTDAIETGNGLERTIELYSGDKLSAPIKKDDIVGTITIKSVETEDVICQGELLATRDVAMEGELNIAVTEETPAPTADSTEVPASQGPVVGLGWLWIGIGVVLVVIIVALIISLVRDRR